MPDVIASDAAHHVAGIFGEETEIGFALGKCGTGLGAIVEFLHEEKSKQSDRRYDNADDGRVGDGVAAPPGERLVGRHRSERHHGKVLAGMIADQAVDAIDRRDRAIIAVLGFRQLLLEQQAAGHVAPDIVIVERPAGQVFPSRRSNTIEPSSPTSSLW